MSNRIVAAIERLRPALKLLSAEKREAVSKTATLEAGEHFHFQEVKSLAQIQGTLTLEEATTLYAALGGAASTFNRQPLETRIVVIQTMTEIIKR